MAGNALREVFARFGVDFDAGPLTAGNSAVDGMASALSGLGNVIAGAAIVQGLRSLTTEIAAVGTELAHSSAALGLSTDELQTWRAAAASAGVSAEQLTPAVGALRRNAAAAALGAAGMRADFRRLGVTLRDENGALRTTEDLLTRTIEGLAGVTDPTRRAGIATRLLGESGARLAPLFERGAEGVAEARRQLELLGGGLSSETIEASEDMTAATLSMDQAFLSLRGRLALFFLPVLTRLSEGMARAVGGVSRLADHSRLLEAALAVLGTAAAAAGARTAVAWAAAAAPFVALGALVLGLILVIDDLWTGLAGGESVLLDLGLAFERWSDEVTAGPIRAVLDAVDLLFASIREVSAFFFDVAGDVTGDRSFNRDAEGLRREGISATLDEIRGRSIARGAAPLSGASPGVDAAVASLGRGAAAAPASVDASRHVEVTINGSGLSAAELERATTRAVDRALARDADDTADALASGGV